MNVRHIIEKSLQMIVVAALFTSCDMMKEDRDDCPTGLYVNFVYDYNIQRADMFKDHVGSVTLYVFDESDKLVAQRTVNGSELSVYGYNIHFTEDELARAPVPSLCHRFAERLGCRPQHGWCQISTYYYEDWRQPSEHWGKP